MRIKKEAVRQVIRNFLFEVGDTSLSNVNYGIYDRPGPSWEGDKDEEKDLTIPDEVPLMPTEMMSTQLVDERPPIEDDEYVPSNPEELSRAARAVAQLVPNSQVDFFYKNLHRLLDRSTEKENTPDLADTDDEEVKEKEGPVEVEKEKNESRIRAEIKRILEQLGDEDPDDLESYRYGSDVPPGYQEIDEPEFEEASQAAANLPAESDGMTFEQLADQFGFSGVPGVRQHIERITGRMQYFVTKTNPEDITTLQDRAVQEYIDLMMSSDLIDDADAVELQQAPGIVKDLDSFRFFFVSGFVLPAYQQVGRDATKRVKAELDSLGVPPKMHQIILNQVTGKTSRDRSAIEKKLSSAADEANMSPEQRDALSQKLSSGFDTLFKLAEFDEDMVKIGLDKWSKFDQNKKEALIKQALGSADDFQEQFGS